MNTLKYSLFVTLLIVVAFFCRKQFAQSVIVESQSKDPPRVFIEQLKTKMNISKNDSRIEIFLNGTKMMEDIKLDVKK